MITLTEEGMLKPEIHQKLGFLRQTVSQVFHAKEKLLQESKNATPVNTHCLEMQQQQTMGLYFFKKQLSFETESLVNLKT